ncbi:MAG: epoxyqueuosine reductase QueH [Minisyncoccia bacterium]
MKEKILLHICCAVCGAYLIELLKEKFEVILYYCNSNIWPEEEYYKRLESVKKLAQEYQVDLIVEKYDHDSWVEKVKGLEKEAEGGKRCEVCFQERLGKTIDYALQNKIKYFSTTLPISPYKSEDLINEIGRKMSLNGEITFLAFSEIEKMFQKDKKELWKKTRELAKKLNLYHQKYCGCEFSLRQMDK